MFNEYTLLQVEQSFKAELLAYLQDAQFARLFCESIQTGYLSIASLKALTILDWTKVDWTLARTSSKDVEGKPYTKDVLINPNLLDFKSQLLSLVDWINKSNLPTDLIWKWITEIAKKRINCPVDDAPNAAR